MGMGLASLELIIFTKEHLNSLHVPGDSAGGGHSQNLIPVALELVGHSPGGPGSGGSLRAGTGGPG